MIGDCLPLLPSASVGIVPVVVNKPPGPGDTPNRGCNTAIASCTRDFEAKYLLDRPSDKPRLLNWLPSLCEADRYHPAARVHSFYFDTRNWQLLSDKLESNFIKHKVRLRWYSDLKSGLSGPASFLEIKRRIGSQREKRRLPFPISGPELAHSGCTPEVQRRVRELLPELGMKLPRGLFPAFEIEYERHRFVDPRSGIRISLDANIETPHVHPTRAAGVFHKSINQVVLEIKGPLAGLPDHLQRLSRLGIRKSSFSKFAACANQIFNMKHRA